jgi:phosphotriesterase-related protein
MLGFDRFNIPHFNPDEDRIRTLLALLEEGYGDRIHLSHDAACFMDFMVGDPNFAGERPDYLHLSTTILPALRARGVTEAQIDELTIDNPRRFLAPS